MAGGACARSPICRTVVSLRCRADGEMSTLRQPCDESYAQISPRPRAHHQLPVVREACNYALDGRIRSDTRVSGRCPIFEVRLYAAWSRGYSGRCPHNGAHSNLPRSSGAKRSVNRHSCSFDLFANMSCLTHCCTGVPSAAAKSSVRRTQGTSEERHSWILD
jgi:hypothetical protein